MKKKIKILQVIGALRVGGAENMVMNFWRYIDKDLFHFDFLVFGESIGEYENEARELGSNIIHINEPAKGYMSFFKNLEQVLIDYGPYDVVHSHTLHNSGLIMLAANRCGVKYRITHSHSTKSRIKENLLTIFYEKVMKYLILKYSTKLLACGKDAGNYLYGNNIFQRKGVIINNGIDIKKYKFNESIRDEYRKKFNIENKLVIGNIARFHKVKNLPFLIDIFSKVKLMHENAILLLVGDGEERESVEKKVEEYDLRDDVLILGFRSDIAEILQAIDIFVMPSLFEGLPVVLIEAQAAGLPCIISDNITDEIQLTQNVEFLNLNDESSFWAKKIIEKASNFQRTDTSMFLQNLGYDISLEVKKLESIYSNSEFRKNKIRVCQK
ncbi:glycosyltransferase family 1 protein [Ureibacillus terrenus]|uniref:glycosyltransferase family 1 protein n=1 Tax=Ureibacillus terrenus TaxID=118246 RepID=UPI002E249277|nr:glycosyltransferase family 1 protein [Ureibacillus terrenus]